MNDFGVLIRTTPEGVPASARWKRIAQAWMSGHASMPDRKLLLLADFLNQQASGR
jgi:hypothetical protein